MRVVFKRLKDRVALFLVGHPHFDVKRDVMFVGANLGKLHAMLRAARDRADRQTQALFIRSDDGIRPPAGVFDVRFFHTAQAAWERAAACGISIA